MGTHSTAFRGGASSSGRGAQEGQVFEEVEEERQEEGWLLLRCINALARTFHLRGVALSWAYRAASHTPACFASSLPASNSLPTLYRTSRMGQRVLKEGLAIVQAVASFTSWNKDSSIKFSQLLALDFESNAMIAVAAK